MLPLNSSNGFYVQMRKVSATKAGETARLSQIPIADKISRTYDNCAQRGASSWNGNHPIKTLQHPHRFPWSFCFSTL